MISLAHYLAIGAILFALGMIGFLSRRNLIVLFICGEMMLLGVSLNFVAFSRFHGNMQGQIFTLFILTIAACEAGLALAFILLLYRRHKSLDISLWQEIHETGFPAPVDTEPLPTGDQEMIFPKLPVAGIEPASREEIIHA